MIENPSERKLKKGISEKEAVSQQNDQMEVVPEKKKEDSDIQSRIDSLRDKLINSPKNALHGEHLEKEFSPIMVSLSDRKGPRTLVNEVMDESSITSSDAEMINFFEDHDRLVEKGMKNHSTESYVISSCNEKAKYSETYRNCTGIVLAGIDKKTGKEISLLSHQYPGSFLGDLNEKFKEDLHTALRDFVERSKEGSIDAIIFGGDYYNKKGHRDDYHQSIGMLSEVCSQELGFEPVVATGPNVDLLNGGPTDVFYDTKNRRLYIRRPEQHKNEANQSYVASQLEEQSPKWKDSFLVELYKKIFE
jgi:hypothetical protein